MTDRDPTLESELKAFARATKRFVKEQFPNREVGFAVLLFDLGEGGHLAYMSSAQRTDMIKALRECAAKLEGGAHYGEPQKDD